MRLLHHDETNEATRSTTSIFSPGPSLDSAAAQENAGETRLTPQEAAEAVAALEAQRLAQSSHAAETISVDEIIAQLGIDATPEELLAARRRAHEANAAKASVPLRAVQPLTQRRRRNVVLIFAGMGGTAAVLLALMQYNLRQQSAMAAVAAAAAQPISIAAPVTEATSTTTNAISLADVGKLTLIDKSSGHPVARLMSEIPDNRPVNVQANVLANTLNIPRTKDYEYGAMKGWWTAKKEHGRVFLKAFLPLQESSGLMAQGNVIVANRSTRPNGVTIGPDPTPVWVPLDRVLSLDCFYSTDSGSKEGDNNGGTFAPDSEGATSAYSNKPLSSDWARATLDGLKPGDLQSAR